MLCYYLFFFFQAEDGIRDADVTGVQTCALPICYIHQHSPRADQPFIAINCAAIPENMLEATLFRSEERRVGKGVDLGGRRIIKKKKDKEERCRESRDERKCVGANW